MLMNKDIESVLVDEKQLDEITTRLAAEIDRDYQDTGRPLVMVCILKGSVMFYKDPPAGRDGIYEGLFLRRGHR